MSNAAAAAVTPLRRRREQAFSVRLPGSKSYTNRALILAAQRPGTTMITGALHSDDTRHLAASLDAFEGLQVERTEDGFQVTRRAAPLGAASRVLDVAAAGTPARFLLAFAAAAQGATVITGNARLRERPMGDLLSGLDGLGIRSTCLETPGCLPVRIEGGTITATAWTVDAHISSQFVSALLLLAAQQPAGPITLQVRGGLASRPYVDMTLSMLAHCGIRVEEADQRFVVHPGPPSQAHLAVEPDASALSYFLVAAAITGTTVEIPNIGSASAQGDVGLARVLERMGCDVDMTPTTLRLRGRPLRGIEVDMETMPDVALSLAVAAIFADGPTRITHIANLRVKECDRIHAAASELQRLGVAVEEGEDCLHIQPRGAQPLGAGEPLRPTRIETYDDHRVAMAFGVLRLCYKGIEIADPRCVAKSFPGYWDELARFKRHHDG